MKTIVITGASDGVGAAAARTLSAQGAKVVIVGRTPARVDAIADELGAERFVADFTRLADVHALAESLGRLDRIDVLANNAGTTFQERLLTEDGFERTFQVNHLAPFLLTQLLMPKLTQAKASVITTSSIGQHSVKLDLNDLQLERGWTPMRAYCTSKLANVLFTRGLHRHHVLEGVYAACFHPGVVASSFAATDRGPMGVLYRSPLGRRFMISPEQGADTLVWLAQRTPPRDWAAGEYYVRRKIGQPNRQVRDSGVVDALWQRTSKMVLG